MSFSVTKLISYYLNDDISYDTNRDRIEEENLKVSLQTHSDIKTFVQGISSDH